MASLNKVMIIGNLGKEPEVSYTPGGMAICKFSVATTEYWTDKTSGERKDKTEWHRIVVFNKLAENCGKYLDKGKQVYVEGRLQTSSYDKDGITRYTTDIIASVVTFLGGGQGQQGQGNQHGYSQKNGYSQNNNNQNGYDNGQGGFNNPPNDDIPF